MCGRFTNKLNWSEIHALYCLAGDHFSHALHELDPAKYPDPMSWIDSHVGGRHGIGTSVEEVSRALGAALDINRTRLLLTAASPPPSTI
ncbi:MAG: hypothetical protein ACM31D_10385 [Bacteroidota bacterium]